MRERATLILSLSTKQEILSYFKFQTNFLVSFWAKLVVKDDNVKLMDFLHETKALKSYLI